MNTTVPKHIAVVVAGPDEEYQSSVLEGMIAAAKQADANLAVFVTFGGVLANSQDDVGEYNIFRLINLKKFDGIILLHNTICAPEICAELIRRVHDSGIPAIALDNSADPSFYNVRINNRQAMRDIVQHVITEHGAKVINYISGPLANPEATARYEAFLEVMAENSIIADARRIYFGQFRPIDGKQAIDELMHSGLSMPDAIIVANDAMALEAITTLEHYGFKVPDDVIVTGFDNTYYAQHHCPSLTTVARPLFEAGRIACETLLRVIDGEDCEKEISLEAEAVFRASCGCAKPSMTDIEQFQKETYDLLKRTRADVNLLNRLTSALAEAENKDEHFRTLSKYLGEIECDRCSVCLCDDWQSSYHESKNENSIRSYQIHGYTSKMSAPLIWEKGRVTEREVFFSQDLYPIPPETGGNVSYFLPLHFRERCLGYYIITNSTFPYRSMLCHSMMMNIGHSLENIRKLLNLNNAIRELDKLYVIDPLCNIYNRNGFIRLADQMFRRCIQTGEQMMISFIDMDGLKYINDNYGHDEGDFALQRLASVLSDICVRDIICARFGGDEFIAVSSGVTTEKAAQFEQNFIKHLSDMNALIHKPYELAASIGTFVTEVTGEMKLFSLITQADQMMYEQKKKKRTSRYLRKD